MIVKKTIPYIVLVLCSALLHAAGPGEVTRSIDCPTVGLSLVLPGGFQPAALTNPNEIVHYVRKAGSENSADSQAKGGDLSQAVTLRVFSASQTDSAEKVADKYSPANDPDFAKVKIISTTPLRIAGLDGLARAMTYERNDANLSAVSVCFLRDVQIPASVAMQITGKKQPRAVRLAYVLTLELPQNKKDSLLPVFDRIVKNVTLTDLCRPVEIPLEFSADRCLKWKGLTVRSLQGWYHRFDKREIVLARPDFVLGGILTPTIRISTRPAAEGQSLEEICRAWMKTTVADGADVKVISQGPAKLGYQIVLQRGPSVVESRPAGQSASQPISQPAEPATATATPALSEIEIRRLFYNPAAGQEKSECLVIRLQVRGCDVPTADVIMNALADGILPTPASGSKTPEKTTCASQPAAVKSQP